VYTQKGARRIGQWAATVDMDRIEEIEAAIHDLPPDDYRRLGRRNGRDSEIVFISSNLGGCSLARIVEEELISIEILDHQKPITP
jgi:hypothetical protein